MGSIFEARQSGSDDGDVLADGELVEGRMRDLMEDLTVKSIQPDSEAYLAVHGF